MTIKTYRAKTIAEALTQVKKDLGRDAVILHTRTIRPAWFALRRRVLTEITATASNHAAAAVSPPRLRPLRGAAPAPAAVLSPPSTDLGPLVEQARERRAELVGAAASAPGDATSSTLGIPTGSPMQAVAQRIIAATERTPIDQDIAAIKRMVGQVLRTTSGAAGCAMPGALFECYQRLLESEVASELADQIVGAVRDELDRAELDDPDIVQRAVLRRLAAHITVSSDSVRVGRAPDGRPTTIALVGPTGVGKTTTIAKLAATYKLRHGRKVGLITCDTYRIAAVDQLRTYANIIGLSLKVALTPTEMGSACDALGDCDVILIDTAGRSPRDSGRLDELKAFIAAARPHQTHLVLSSASGETALAEAARRFGPVGFDRVILTKLDEAVNFGVLVNVIHGVNARLSFVTTGQEVPDHIEPGNADRLARIILSGEAVG